MNKIEVKQKVIDILIDIGGINDKNQITNNTRLVEDLNFNSFNSVNCYSRRKIQCWIAQCCFKCREFKYSRWHSKYIIFACLDKYNG